MKKVITTTTRKVYSTQSPSPQTTTIRRLNNSSDGASPVILNSGTPRILKQSTITRHVSPAQILTQSSPANSLTNSSSGNQLKCYVCDGQVGGQGSLLMETQTNHSHTKLPNKISRVIGDAFLVIVRADDIVCRRCVNLFNDVDRLESELEKAKGQLMTFICKKYSIEDDGARPPAAKVQKLSADHADVTVASLPATTTVRKVVTVGGGAGSGPTASPTAGVGLSPNGPRRTPVKIYKCMSCEFTTGDLKQFTPHYSVCPGVAAENNGSPAAATTTPASSHPVAAVSSGGLSNSHSQAAATTISPSNKVLARRPLTQTLQQAASKPEHACTMCQFKSRDKTTFDEHVRRHIRAKPFKCRICSMRFETRETASKHARTHSTEYYKCGTCSQAFREREALIKHFEVHQKDGNGGQQIIIKAQASSVAAAMAATSGTTAAAAAAKLQPPSTASTQKLLQETIDEALRDSAAETLVDAKNIHFFSCSICSLTFIQENYYTQHMETHKRESASAATPASKRTAAKIVSQQQSAAVVAKQTAAAARSQKTNGQSLMKQEVNDDLESIFEKMHSDKAGAEVKEDNADSQTGIDMPALDQGEEVHEEQVAASAGGPPVSMPSLDDDGENSEQQAANTSAEGGEPMEIEDMHNSVEGGEQLKFIVNENGQLLQLDNHILTDADGNQIIVQGADSEHFQQLLQSVAGLEGGTIQMIQGENNQMILVQQGDNEPQLIDASMLNADGQIVIQQGAAEGEMSVDGHSQSSEDVAAATQQQQQPGEYEAGDEAVAVLAAAAEQHHLQATTTAAAASANSAEAAVDDSSQEDLEEQIAVHTVATTSGAQRDGGGAETSMQSDDNSQEAAPTAPSTTADDDGGDAPVSGGGGTVDGGGAAAEDDASQESQERGDKGRTEKSANGKKEEDTVVSTTTTDEKISSSTKEEGYRFF